MTNRPGLLLFGPPGIGKSTIIKLIAYRPGLVAVDLELVYPVMGQMMEILEDLRGLKAFGPYVFPYDVVVGAANLDPTRHYLGYKRALLTLSETDYAARRAERDARHPEMANQPIHTMEHWLSLTNWDYLIRANRKSTYNLMRVFRSM